MKAVASKPEAGVLDEVELYRGISRLQDRPHRPPKVGWQRPLVHLCPQRLDERTLVLTVRGIESDGNPGSDVRTQERLLDFSSRIGLVEVGVEAGVLGVADSTDTAEYIRLDLGGGGGGAKGKCL